VDRAAQTRLDESLYTAEHVEGWFEPYALLARSAVVRRVGALLERFLHTLRLRFELLRGCLEAAGFPESVLASIHALAQTVPIADCAGLLKPE
jgi:hypothetical protein